jgi:hypothetical protein
MQACGSEASAQRCRGFAVGQAEEDHVHLIGAGEGVGQGDERIGPRHRVEVTVRFAGARFAGHPAHAHLRVALEQLNQLKTCIAGGAGDAGAKLLAHDHLCLLLPLGCMCCRM